MKTFIENLSFPLAKIVIAFSVVLSLFSCTKDNSSNPKDNKNHSYCGTINWSNTIGLSGYITGVERDGMYDAVATSIKEKGIEHFFGFHHDANYHLVNDQPNTTYTYVNDKISKIVIGGGSGSITYNFDAHVHLTTVESNNSDETGKTNSLFTYTYDGNGDPVKIVGQVTDLSTEGKTSTASYNVIADYLLDKPAIIPPSAELTPFTIYFSYYWCLSTHLINKWQIKISGTDDNGNALPVTNFTQQYTYTYNDKGMVGTMVHTGNSKNIFTFTFSECK